MDVWDCALGFMNAQILFTADELGVFDRLDAAPTSADELAAGIGLPPDAAERLLSALAALGFVIRTADGGWANGPEATKALVRGRPGYVGHMFRHLREDLYPVWRHLPEALRDGKAQWHRAFPDRPTPTENMYDDPAKLRAFLEGMHAITYGAAAQFADQAPELRRVERLVDVGGASGAFVIALAERFPELQGTVFDLPAVRPVAEDFFRQHGLDGRLAFHPGDFWEDPVPDAEAHALGFILHDWDDKGGDILLDKVSSATVRGGLLVLGEFLLDEDRTGPLFVARQDLNMLVAARGRERTAREYADWIGRFGYETRRVVPTAHGKNFIIAERL